MKPVSSQRIIGARAGFSIIEGVGAVVITAIIMGVLTYSMGGLFNQQSHPQVAYNNQTYTQAPSFDDFSQAIDLHTAFTNAVDQADNVIVLGGTRSHPVLDPVIPSGALDESFQDTTLTAMVGADPFTAFSSWDQREQNNSQFSTYLTSNADAADFTILTVQGLSHITSITQQRRYAGIVINGQSLSLYEVTHQSIDWLSGVPVPTPNATTGSTPTYYYRFYYATSEDLWAMPPGATHYWYRSDTTWDRDQEGPARVVFADPYSMAGQDSASALSPMSRFIYFLSQVR